MSVPTRPMERLVSARAGGKLIKRLSEQISRRNKPDVPNDTCYGDVLESAQKTERDQDHEQHQHILYGPNDRVHAIQGGANEDKIGCRNPAT